MHVPTSQLHGRLCPVTAAVSVVMIVLFSIVFFQGFLEKFTGKK